MRWPLKWQKEIQGSNNDVVAPKSNITLIVSFSNISYAVIKLYKNIDYLELFLYKGLVSENKLIFWRPDIRYPK
ncbi:MAG TPA: hypothetical protein VF884_15900 [Nitrososphaeraceae archaeon]